MAEATLEILQTVDRDEEGFMTDPNAWTEAIAGAIATEEGLELTDRHWIVINFMRAEYSAKGEPPNQVSDHTADD